MKNLTQTPYYKRLKKLSVWPIVAVVSLAIVTVAILMSLFYLNYMSVLSELISQMSSPDTLIFLESGVNKFILSMIVWMFALLALNIRFFYTILSVKKLLADFESIAK